MKETSFDNPYAATSEPIAPTADTSGGSKWFGIFGLGAGVVGLILSVASYHVFEERMEKKTSLTINLGIAKWKYEKKPEPPKTNWRNMFRPGQVRAVALSFAAIALVCSVVSWVRKEPVWMGLTSCVFAAAAAAWVWFMLAFAIVAMSGGFFAFAPVRQRAKQHAA